MSCKIRIDKVETIDWLKHGVPQEVLFVLFDEADGEEVVIATTNDMKARQAEDFERWYWVRQFCDENGKDWNVWYDMDEEVSYVSYGPID